MSPSVTEVILHCQKQIKKEPDEERLLHYLRRLKRLRIHVQDLQETGIGRTINQLSRVESRAGQEAWNLVQQWKAVVEAEKPAGSSSGSEDSGASSSEDEADKGSEPPVSKMMVSSSSVVESPSSSGDSKRPRPPAPESEEEEAEESGSDSESSDRLCIADGPGTAKLSQEPLDGTSSSSSSSDSSSESEAEDEALSKENGSFAEAEPKPSLPPTPSPPLRPKSRPSPDSQSHGDERKENSSSEDSDSSSSEEDYSPPPPPPPPPAPKDNHSHRHHHKSSRHHTHEREGGKEREERSKGEESAPSHHHHRSKSSSNQKSSKEKKESEREKSSHKSDHRSSSNRHHHHHRHREVKEERGEAGRVKTEKVEAPKVKTEKMEIGKGGSEKWDPSKVKSEKMETTKLKPEKVDASKGKPEKVEVSKGKAERAEAPKVKTEKMDSDRVKSSSKHGHRDREKVRTPEPAVKGKSDPSAAAELNGGTKVKMESRSKERRGGEDRKKEVKRKGEEPHENDDRKKMKLETAKKSAECLKPKLLPRLNVEIDSTSGVNFSDVLNCLDSKKLSKSGGSKSKAKKASVILPPAPVGPRLITPTTHISSNYTPGPSRSLLGAGPPVNGREGAKSLKTKIQAALDESLNDDKYWEDSRLTLGSGVYESEGDRLSAMITSRNQKTKVYSGVKSGFVGQVPSLFTSCLRVIQDNIEDLGYTGGVPYEILQPALIKTTATQLLQVEHYNPYLIESTDNLWEFHTKRDFRGKSPLELESWRELYLRCMDERSARFETLTNKLKTKMDVATPVRKAKLAYVDTTSGPKFSKTKAATIKTGMNSLKRREDKGQRGHGSSASSGGGGNNNQANIVIEEASVIISGKQRRAHSGGGGGAPSREPALSSAKLKPKKAPLMQKTLKSMKNLYRR